MLLFIDEADAFLCERNSTHMSEAQWNRIDEVIEFPLPGDEERFQLLRLYLNQYMFKEDGKGSFWGSLLNKQRQKIHGKLVASVQAAVHGLPDCVLDPQLFMEKAAFFRPTGCYMLIRDSN
ncbi:hypothetical protein GUJ93_ZPchr0006g40924 [Zizania palustris]|uniref:ATPase AAA-type core domain-containing protein n=1 Tax=Zizania palustris TaxID=103762 RepID=A0A8J5W329_ZIZPA|nr:hypothetical protein GUJ93_ZPchr0006g40924 [Zizania palustris]